jgi:hypothetical protein
VRGGEGVEPGVDQRRGKRQREVGAAVAKTDGQQPATGERGADDEERQSPSAPVRPDADRDRHHEAGERVDGHHRSDQGRRVLDVLEQHR